MQEALTPLGDKGGLHLEVMAGRAAQPDGIPGVDNLTIALWKEKGAHFRCSIGAQPRAGVSNDERSTIHPGRFGTPAGKAPASIQPVTPLDRHRPSLAWES